MKLLRRMIAIAVLAVTLSMLSPGVAQACVNCPRLNIKKDGPCLLR